MIDDLKRLYESAATFKAVYQFNTCGHVATFPDDALWRAEQAKKADEVRYWSDNSRAHEHPATSVGSQGCRTCPHCPGTDGWGPCELIERGREWDGPESERTEPAVSAPSQATLFQEVA